MTLHILYNTNTTKHNENKMSLQALKKNRKAAIEKLANTAKDEGGGKKSYGDDRYWAVKRDKAGNASAVIRFLPAPDGEEVPWVRYWDHGFQGPSGRWYIENSLTTIGKDDPVSDYNSEIWNRPGSEEDKKADHALVRQRKRRLHYVSNIYVVKDSANPENEGKVFLYKYGKKIFDKINDVMDPKFEDQDAVNPFDLWDGANFRLRVCKEAGWVNYDKSEFASPSALHKDDEVLEDIYSKVHSLEALLDPKNYKSYGELKEKFIAVLGEDPFGDEPAKAERKVSERSDPEPENEPASDTGSEVASDDATDAFFDKLGDDDDITF